MSFVELTNFGNQRPILIDAAAVTSIEAEMKGCWIRVDNLRIQVMQSHREVQKLVEDARTNKHKGRKKSDGNVPL